MRDARLASTILASAIFGQGDKVKARNTALLAFTYNLLSTAAAWWMKPSSFATTAMAFAFFLIAFSEYLMMLMR